MIRNNSFVYGVDVPPAWFVDQSRLHNVKYTYSGDNLISTKAKTMNGWEELKKGDTVMNMLNNMIIVPADAAKKYGVE